MTLVSVCVPAYERPGMLAELIDSFAVQSLTSKELCIVDDSESDVVQEMVRARQQEIEGIRYLRNRTRLGFGQNLRRCLLEASGDVVVVLGDDDVLASREALDGYAQAFAAYPDCAVAYGNLVQVDAALRCTLLYPFYETTQPFAAGRAALEHLLLRSILITGLAFRRTDRLEALYPRDEVLFPQVELVAGLLQESRGMGIASYLCATRAHSEQLGFRAIRGLDVRGRERHGNIEVMETIAKLTAGDDGAPLRASLERQLVHAFLTNVPNEKIQGGNRAVLASFRALIETNTAARRSPALWATVGAALVTPRPLLGRLKGALRERVLRRRAEATSFDVSRPLQTLSWSR